MKIPLKTVSGVCACGIPFTIELPSGIKDPTMCDECVLAFQEAREAERRAHNIRDLANACGIPEKYRVWDDAIAERMGNRKFLDILRNAGLESAWIGGDNGIGKTHAMTYRVYELLQEKGIISYVVRSSAWLREVVTLRTGRDVAEGDRRYKKATTTKLLVMDDIGKERLSAPRAELLYDIIDERDREELPIWFTSNFSGKTLVDRLNAAGGEDGGHEYGKAILTRLKRMIPQKNVWRADA